MAGFVYSYIGVAIGFLITGIFMPHIFNPDEIGLFRVLVSYSSLLAQISGLGFSVVAVRMFPYFRDYKTKNHGFFGLYLIVGFVGFLLTSALYLSLKPLILYNSADKSILFARYYYLVIPTSFSILFFLVVDTYYRLLFNATKGILFKEVIQRALILIILFLYYLGVINLNLSVYLYILAICLPGFLLFIPLWFTNEISFKPDFNFFSGETFKQMKQVAIYGILTSLAGGLVINIDTLMIQQSLGLHDTGIYGITFFFGTLVLIPSRPVIKISSVFVAEAFKKKDVETVLDIYRKSSINLGIIGLLIFIGLWINLDNIFIIITEKFRAGEIVILLIAGANLLDMFMALSMQIISNSDHFKFATYAQLIFVVFLIGTNFLLIPQFGIIGAGLATLLSKAVFNLTKYLVIYWKIGIQPFTIKTLLLLIIACITLFIINKIPPFSMFIIDIFVRSISAIIIYGILILQFRISNEVIAKFKESIKVVKSTFRL